MIAAIADGADLVELLWTSVVAGIGITAVYGIAIVGASRALDASRSGRMVAAAAFGVVGVVAVVVVLAAIVVGIVVMGDK